MNAHPGKTPNQALSYARVSSRKQALNGYSLENQAKLAIDLSHTHSFKLVKMFTDKAISVSRGSKKQDAYREMMAYCEENDIKRIYTFAIDRLGRTQLEIFKFFEWAKERNIQVFITSNRQLMDPSNKNDVYFEMWLSMTALWCRIETIQREERVNVARDRAKKEGRCGPRSRRVDENGKTAIPLIDHEHVLSLLESGELTPSKIAMYVGCSRSSVYDIRKRMMTT